MFLPSFGAREHKNAVCPLRGLDRRAKAPAGTLSQCENMSADAYPALTPANPETGDCGRHHRPCGAGTYWSSR